MATEKARLAAGIAAKIHCESYFACAEIDKWAPPADIDKLAAALRDAATQHRIEWYPGVSTASSSRSASGSTTAPRPSVTGSACSLSSIAPCGGRGPDRSRARVLCHERGCFAMTSCPSNDDNAIPDVRAVRAEREVLTRQRLPYFVGISGETVGARGLSMHLVVIPPGAQADPHSHRGYETAIYVLEGKVETRYGACLESRFVSEAGDFLFIPPGISHEAINVNATEPARAIVSRNDPAEQDNVVPYDATPR